MPTKVLASRAENALKITHMEEDRQIASIDLDITEFTRRWAMFKVAVRPHLKVFREEFSIREHGGLAELSNDLACVLGDMDKMEGELVRIALSAAKSSTRTPAQRKVQGDPVKLLRKADRQLSLVQFAALLLLQQKGFLGGNSFSRSPTYVLALVTRM